MTSIVLLSSKSSICAMQFLGVWGQHSSGVAVGKQRGDLESGCDRGPCAPHNLALGPLVPFSPGTSQGLSVSLLQWKSGSLTSNILLPPSACLRVMRNDTISTCSSSRWSLSPCISAHDLACLLLPLFPLYFLHHFSPLVIVLFLPPWASTNPRVLQHGNIRRRTMCVWPQSLISPLLN